MINSYFFILFMAISHFVFADHLFDFGSKEHHFILEEKQIVIPGYPDAFNPTVIRWQDGRLLLSFRTRDKITAIANHIGFVWVDENFIPQGDPSLLRVIDDRSIKKSHMQDPKLVQVGEDIYVIFNNLYKDNDSVRRLYVAKLNHGERGFFISHPQPLLKFEGDKEHQWKQKGWAPFEYEGDLMLSYNFNPHQVMRCFPFKKSYETVGITAFQLDWEWGELSGGTPPLKDGNHYLGFFQSHINVKSRQSNGDKMAHYFMGAFLFSAEAPFEMTHISPSPLIGETFYHSPEYKTWKPLKVIYPGGFIFDEDYVWVVYGRQDFESWVVKMDKKGLMDSLIPVVPESKKLPFCDLLE